MFCIKIHLMPPSLNILFIKAYYQVIERNRNEQKKVIGDLNHQKMKVNDYQHVNNNCIHYLFVMVSKV